LEALVSGIGEAWQDLGSLVNAAVVVVVRFTDQFDGVTAVVADDDGAGGGDGAIGFLGGFDPSQLVVGVAVDGAVILVDLGITVGVGADSLFGDSTLGVDVVGNGALVESVLTEVDLGGFTDEVSVTVVVVVDLGLIGYSILVVVVEDGGGVELVVGVGMGNVLQGLVLPICVLLFFDMTNELVAGVVEVAFSAGLVYLSVVVIVVLGGADVGVAGTVVA